MIIDFQKKLEQYADLIVKIGLNIQPGQRLLMVDGSRNHGIPLTVAPLAREIAKKAYQAGASFVDVIWADDQMKLIRFQNAPRDSFEIFPQWLADGILAAVKRGDAMLNIQGINPDLLIDQDPELIGQWQKTVLTKLKPAAEYTLRNAVNWCLVAASIPGWALKVFPDLNEDEAVDCLWEAIFKLVRLDQADPYAIWQEHILNLSKRTKYLQSKSYKAFHYLAPGTDLTVGLPAGHLWKGGQITSEAGIPFVPNLPTEEVFTLADKSVAEGFVQSTKTLAYSGHVVEDFRLEFSGGKVVNFAAKKGEIALRKLFETDEGASRLGEVALVPHMSPISQSGIIFHHTLMDENAASHLALGAAYNFTLHSGETMSKEQFSAAGGNISIAHVDFMIGSGQMDVDGLKHNGSAEPVMRSGEWAFDV